MSGSPPKPRSSGPTKPCREKAFLPNPWVCNSKWTSEGARQCLRMNKEGSVETEGKQVYW